jgi:CubicO group peptidase (beta-lactamase class C family)
MLNIWEVNMYNYQNIVNPLHEMLTEFVDNEQLPGLSVGIVMANQILFAGEYGTANVSTGEEFARAPLFY